MIKLTILFNEAEAVQYCRRQGFRVEQKTIKKECGRDAWTCQKWMIKTGDGMQGWAELNGVFLDLMESKLKTILLNN